MELNTTHYAGIAQKALKFQWTPFQLDVIGKIAEQGYVELDADQMNDFDGGDRTGEKTYRCVLNKRAVRSDIAKRHLQLVAWDEVEPPVNALSLAEVRAIVRAFVALHKSVEFIVDNDDRADVHEMIAEFAPEAIYSFFSDAEFTTFKLIK